MPIRRLPPLLVNQIAAGEVIERPASVVKELVENAIDAGAMRIDVVIEDGGRELIRVRDNGSGIPAEELPLALAPHATSKIAASEDLDAIATMGFRGEALASIASVSRVSVLSRTAATDGGALLEAEGETVGHIKPAAGPIGTTVTVRNLFFNTPARRKFLRTDATETSRIAEMVETLALAHPAITFTLVSHERSLLDLPAEETPKRRVLAVLGRELEGQLLEVQIDRLAEGGVACWGLAGTPEIARANASHMRLYLNGRSIRDRSLQHALKEAYRGLIEPGRYPTLVLFLDMHPAQVDVNVHPTKAEVRFRNQGLVHSAVLHAVRERLREADLTPSFNFARVGGGGGDASDRPWWSPKTAGVAPAEFGPSDRGGGPAPVIRTPGDFVEYFRRLDPVQKGFVYGEVKQVVEQDPLSSVAVDSGGAGIATDGALGPGVKPASDIMQVHASYLVTQDERGLVIIDQHALHERVMFEKLVSRVAAGDLESQRLLMPVVIEVDRTRVDGLEVMRPLLKRIGIDAEPMGPATVAVHAFPSFLFERGVEVEPFMRELLGASGALTGTEADVERALHETLDMMACKAAVKAGDHLSPAEVRELLACRESIERSSNCPHGRPTSLRLTIEDLNRQFGRS